MSEHDHDKERSAAGSPTGRPGGLGDLLVEARTRKGLELSDIAELTHVRLEYLRALEEGRYSDLPEDVYSRNYVRLYAQAVGLETDPVLDTYARERRRAVGMSTLEQRLEQERRGEIPEQDRRRGLPFGALLPTLLLVVVLVGLAVWGFNSLLFRPTRAPLANQPTGGTPTVATAPAAGPTGSQPAASTSGSGAQAPSTAAAPAAGSRAGSAPAGVVGDAVQARTVQVSIDTQPPGASVSIDGFALPGTTPIKDAPVTAREGRQVKITLAGYQPLVTTVDLRQSRTLSYTLTPTAQTSAQAPTPAGTTVTPSEVGPKQIGINITARTWLEVYQSTARNQGNRLVYATVDAGKHYIFNLPVYLHVGNAAGVDLVLHNKDLGSMGSPGAVVSRAFPAP
jgi:cytoskeleton protein RodZ